MNFNGKSSETIRLSRATVQFTAGVVVDGYQTPNGEYRVGIVGAAKALGYGKQWLSQVLSRRGKSLESLQGLGFTGSQLDGIAERDAGISGASRTSTISIQDFAVLVAYAASQGKKPAIALQLALCEMSLRDFFRDAFGERPLSLVEKRELFYKSYAKTMDWLADDKSDIENLWLAGDPPELLDWNH